MLLNIICIFWPLAELWNKDLMSGSLIYLFVYSFLLLVWDCFIDGLLVGVTKHPANVETSQLKAGEKSLFRGLNAFNTFLWPQGATNGFSFMCSVECKQHFTGFLRLLLLLLFKCATLMSDFTKLWLVSPSRWWPPCRWVPVCVSPSCLWSPAPSWSSPSPGWSTAPQQWSEPAVQSPPWSNWLPAGLSASPCRGMLLTTELDK